MKMKKLARVFTSAVLVSAMVMTMGGMTSFAGVEQLPLTKKVTTDGNTYAPATTFTFDLKPGPGGILGQGDTKLNENTTAGLEVAQEHLGKVVYPGVIGGLSIDNVPTDAFKFEPVTESEGKLVAPAESYEKASNIAVNVSVFTKPGIYHYQMKENVPGENNLSNEQVAGTKYDGISYDNKVRDIYVYVENNLNSTGEDDKYVINTIIVAVDGEKQSGTQSTSHNNGVVFENHYGDKNTPYDPDVNELSVTKSVAGNQGDKDQPFKFYFTVNGADGEAYKWITYTTDEENPTTTNVITSGAVGSVDLKHGESFKIFGLSATDEYKVGEVDYGSDGYTTSYTISEGKTMEDGELTSGEGETAVTVSAKKGNIVTSAGEITVTNDKTVTTPTGIVLSFAPYILLVALAGVFGVLFLRRRKEEF